MIYSAYGKWEKPRIYSSPENGAGAEKWELWHDENGIKIWKFYRDITEVGNIVLNGGEFIQSEWVDGATLSTRNMFSDNLVEKSQYGFWLWDNSTGDSLDTDIVFWDNTTISGNYVLYMGCGWHGHERVVYLGKVMPDGKGGTVSNAWAFAIAGLPGGVLNMLGSGMSAGRITPEQVLDAIKLYLGDETAVVFPVSASN